MSLRLVNCSRMIVVWIKLLWLLIKMRLLLLMTLRLIRRLELVFKVLLLTMQMNRKNITLQSQEWSLNCCCYCDWKVAGSTMVHSLCFFKTYDSNQLIDHHGHIHARSYALNFTLFVYHYHQKRRHCRFWINPLDLLKQIQKWCLTIRFHVVLIGDYNKVSFEINEYRWN